MDKKSILLGIACLGGGFALMIFNAKQETESRQYQLEQRALQESEAVDAYSVEDSPTQISDSDIPAFETSGSPVSPSDASDAIIEDVADENAKTFTLENSVFRVTFSTFGGAIKTVELKDYPRENPNYSERPGTVVLNDVSDTPALALKRDLGNRFLPLIATYKLENITDTRIQFIGRLSESLAVRRIFEVTASGEKHELYSIQHRTEFINTSDQSLSLQPLFINLGTAAPTDADYRGFNLNASYFDDGDYDTIQATKFSGGFFGGEPKTRIAEEGSLAWGAVKNQFFTSIYTPTTPANSIVARAIKFPPNPVTLKESDGITAALRFTVPAIGPQQTQILEGSFYVGPTDFDVLSQLGNKQEDVMQLGWFMGMFLGIISFVAKVLLTVMSTVHGWVGNWGVAIIITTLVIRLVLYPLTAKAARAAKRMQKLSKPMQEIREKYKDNQQKANQAVMEYMKKHKINPLSGCWPVLVQFPIFIAFFNLLRNSSDLRFAEFLWIHDLSRPDATIQFSGSLPFIGNSLNVLPFVWLVSMIFQMRMMPSPGGDNSQMKLMKWMPLIFFPFTYFFSSGLVLYWTTTNTFSVFQQWMTNRTRDAEDEIIEAEEVKAASRAPLISKKKKKKKK